MTLEGNCHSYTSTAAGLLPSHVYLVKALIHDFKLDIISSSMCSAALMVLMLIKSSLNRW